jgi:hypothetical protein
VTKKTAKAAKALTTLSEPIKSPPEPRRETPDYSDILLTVFSNPRLSQEGSLYKIEHIIETVPLLCMSDGDFPIDRLLTFEARRQTLGSPKDGTNPRQLYGRRYSLGNSVNLQPTILRNFA